MKKIKEENITREEFIKRLCVKMEEFKGAYPNADGTISLCWEVEEPRTIYDLEVGDSFYYIYHNGGVYRCVIDTIPRYESYKNMLSIGNVFLTEREAEIELQKKQVESELKKYAFQPNWKDYSQAKWTLYYYYENNETIWSDWCDCQYGCIYFENESMIKKAIEKVGKERVDAYLKGEFYKKD